VDERVTLSARIHCKRIKKKAVQIHHLKNLSVLRAVPSVANVELLRVSAGEAERKGPLQQQSIRHQQKIAFKTPAATGC
jgi:hypothetical protein